MIKYLRPEYTNVFFAADVDCVLKTSPQNPAGIAPDIMIAPSHALAALKFYKKDRKLYFYLCNLLLLRLTIALIASVTKEVVYPVACWKDISQKPAHIYNICYFRAHYTLCDNY